MEAVRICRCHKRMAINIIFLARDLNKGVFWIAESHLAIGVITYRNEIVRLEAQSGGILGDKRTRGASSITTIEIAAKDVHGRVSGDTRKRNE